MREHRPATKPTAMSADAYAGFLRLLVTPTSKVPTMSAELEAYLRYANEREPLSLVARRAMGDSPQQAA